MNSVTRFSMSAGSWWSLPAQRYALSERPIPATINHCVQQRGKIDGLVQQLLILLEPRQQQQIGNNLLEPNNFIFQPIQFRPSFPGLSSRQRQQQVHARQRRAKFMGHAADQLLLTLHQLLQALSHDIDIHGQTLDFIPPSRPAGPGYPGVKIAAGKPPHRATKIVEAPGQYQGNQVADQTADQQRGAVA